MPKKTAVEVETLVRHLSKGGLSHRAIRERLKSENFEVSKTTIGRILCCEGNRRNHKSVGLPSPEKFQPSPKVTKEVIRRVDAWTDKENPPSQLEIAKRLNISPRTVRRIIVEKLDKKVKVKHRVHALKESHKQNRKTNSRKLYEGHLAGGKSEFVVTLDEAWFYITDCNSGSKIYYHKHGYPDPNFVKQKSERFCKKFMAVGAMTGRGVIPLIRVPPKTKINTEVYIQKVLAPILEKKVPELYPGELEKVFFHHDAAPSHTSKKTAQYLQGLEEKLGINVILNSEIPVKSPDGSPMDFYGFGMLKGDLNRSRVKTLDGAWNFLQKSWNGVTVEEVTRVYAAWKRRLRMIAKGQGEHIEQTKKIHMRKLTD
jgi:hypothetical protein